LNVQARIEDVIDFRPGDTGAGVQAEDIGVAAPAPSASVVASRSFRMTEPQKHHWEGRARLLLARLSHNSNNSHAIQQIK